MFDFQQLVSDLSEEKLIPSVPVKGNQVEMLKISDRIKEDKDYFEGN